MTPTRSVSTELVLVLRTVPRTSQWPAAFGPDEVIVTTGRVTARVETEDVTVSVAFA